MIIFIKFKKIGFILSYWFQFKILEMQPFYINSGHTLNVTINNISLGYLLHFIFYFIL